MAFSTQTQPVTNVSALACSKELMAAAESYGLESVVRVATTEELTTAVGLGAKMVCLGECSLPQASTTRLLTPSPATFPSQAFTTRLLTPSLLHSLRRGQPGFLHPLLHALQGRVQPDFLHPP